MQITVRNLLIFVACVGVALGQARLPVSVGMACLVPEIMLLGYIVPRRLSLWMSLGIGSGLILGMVVWSIAIGWTEVNPASFSTLDELRSASAGQTARMWRFGSYCIQVGALTGGTLGLILGQVRFLIKRRTLAGPTASDRH